MQLIDRQYLAHKTEYVQRSVYLTYQSAFQEIVYHLQITLQDIVNLYAIYQKVLDL